jgi:hypothetical protein
MSIFTRPHDSVDECRSTCSGEENVLGLVDLPAEARSL